MNVLNVKQLNTIGLNQVPLNVVRLDGSVGKKNLPWTEYVQDGMVFQLDCKLLPTTLAEGRYMWKDVQSRNYAVIYGEYAVDTGIYIEDGTKIIFPTVTGSPYVEICHKVDDVFSTDTYDSLATYTTESYVYSIRVYNKTLTDEQKAINKAIDEKRFGSKEFTLDESILDGNDWLV